MSNETVYVAAENGIHAFKRGQEDSAYPVAIWGSAELSYENVAKLLNDAYQRGRNEQREDIRKALGLR